MKWLFPSLYYILFILLHYYFLFYFIFLWKLILWFIFFINFHFKIFLLIYWPEYSKRKLQIFSNFAVSFPLKINSFSKRNFSNLVKIWKIFSENFLFYMNFNAQIGKRYVFVMQQHIWGIKLASPEYFFPIFEANFFRISILFSTTSVLPHCTLCLSIFTETEYFSHFSFLFFITKVSGEI